MNFFETLIRPDKEEDPIRAAIAEAANILQIGEFQFLQLAYGDWFGEEMPEQMHGAVFRSYNFHKQVPHWARHYSRKVLDIHARGLLNDADPAFHRYDNEYYTYMPNGVRRFSFAVLCLTVLMGGMLLLGHFAAEPGSSVLPPYFPEEAPVEQQTNLRGS